MVYLSSETHFLSDSVFRMVTVSVTLSHLCREASRNPTTLSNSVQTPFSAILCQPPKGKTTFLWKTKGASMVFKRRLSLDLVFLGLLSTFVVFLLPTSLMLLTGGFCTLELIH